MKKRKVKAKKEVDEGYSIISLDYNDKPKDLFPNSKLTEKNIFNPEGKLISKEVYHKKELIEKTDYTEDGIVCSKKRFLSGLMGVYEYNENGTIKEAGIYDEKGKKFRSEKFIHNEKEELIEWSRYSLIGGWQSIKKYTYHENGAIKSLSDCRGDKIPFDSTITLYYKNGTRKELSSFNQDGNLQQKMKYFKNGDVCEITNYHNLPTTQPRTVNKYNKQGKIAEESEYKEDGVMHLMTFYNYTTDDNDKTVSEEIIKYEYDAQGNLKNKVSRIFHVEYFNSNKELDNKYKELTEFDDKGNWIFKKIIKKIKGKIISPADIIVRKIEYY